MWLASHFLSQTSETKPKPTFGYGKAKQDFDLHKGLRESYLYSLYKDAKDYQSDNRVSVDERIAFCVRQQLQYKTKT